MCGISGAFSRYSYIDLQTYYIAHSLLKHRGPDGEGFAAGNTSSYPVITYSGDNSTGSSRSFPHILSCRSQHKWILGHHRLSIIDLSDKGHQPMASPDKRYWLVYNGEIYNYRELRADLENLGCEFHTQTDTEVVVYALEEWGIDAFSYFNGMWALAWYDTQTGNLLLSRDRFGIKPLYYSLGPDCFYFGSEAKFFKPLMPLSMNESAAMDYLALCYLDHKSQSFYNDINQIQPASYAVFNSTKGSWMRKQYWTLKKNQKKSALSHNESMQKFNELFESAIQLRMRSDVPVGSLLSGGLDSSSIICCLRRNASVDAEGFHFFSAVFRQQEYSEKKYISLIENIHKGLIPHYVYPTEEVLLTHLGALDYTLDFPYRSLASFSQNLLYRKVRQDSPVTVLLNGQGGDELFGGYTAHYYSLMASYLFSLKTVSLMKEALYFSQNRMTDLKNVLKAMLKQSLFHVIRVAFHIRHSAGPGKVFRYPAKIHAPVFSADPFESNLKENLLYSALPEYLRYEDRNSMSYSLETRLPFLDYRLVEWAFTLPSNFKIAHGKNKAIVRDAVSSYVPSEIIDRKDKMGFVSPQEIWQRELLKPLIEEAVHGIRLPFLHYRRLRQYYEQYQNRSSNDWPFWWRISSLYRWMNSV